MADFDFCFDSHACKSCGGRCCVGESGYIFLTISEAESIARFLGMGFDDFALRYMKKVGYRFSLIEKPMKNQDSGMACVFFDEESGGCGIYACRPKQCVSFPFWDGFARDCASQALEELCALCPGVRLCENNAESTSKARS